MLPNLSWIPWRAAWCAPNKARRSRREDRSVFVAMARSQYDGSDSVSSISIAVWEWAKFKSISNSFEHFFLCEMFTSFLMLSVHKANSEHGVSNFEPDLFQTKKSSLHMVHPETCQSCSQSQHRFAFVHWMKKKTIEYWLNGITTNSAHVLNRSYWVSTSDWIMKIKPCNHQPKKSQKKVQSWITKNVLLGATPPGIEHTIHPPRDSFRPSTWIQHLGVNMVHGFRGNESLRTYEMNMAQWTIKRLG